MGVHFWKSLKKIHITVNHGDTMSSLAGLLINWSESKEISKHIHFHIILPRISFRIFVLEEWMFSSIPFILILLLLMLSLLQMINVIPKIISDKRKLDPIVHHKSYNFKQLLPVYINPFDIATVHQKHTIIIIC